MDSDMREKLEQATIGGEAANHGTAHLLAMYYEIVQRDQPVVLELGTQTGSSTRIFLGAIQEGDGGQLVSVDIEDCSNAAESSLWTFIQSDSADIKGIISAAPILKLGIDVLYIDSLHHVDHVKKELFGFFPFLKQGGVIFFDDVDSLPYMRGREKDNIHTEIGNRTILNFLNEAFEDNVEKLYFSISRGASGLARLEKRTKLGDELSDEQMPRARTSKRYWKTRRSILKRLGLLLPSINSR
ncbi:putative O-methyltransferase YrrM [Labrenzia sp. EL_126]|nr:putative O-methyltransferase YrrM [Labrenzia sp. EL_126]